MATTTPTGLHIPTTGDAPNIPADLLTLAGDLDIATVPLFASNNARDSAYAQREFGLCFVGPDRDAATLYRRRGGQWREMADIDALTGSGWKSLELEPGFTGSVQMRRTLDVCEIRFDVTGSITTDVAVASGVAAGDRPSDGALIPATMYANSDTGKVWAANVYLSGSAGTVRAVSRGDGGTIERIRGNIIWLAG